MWQGECSVIVTVTASSKVVQVPGFESQLTLLPSRVALDKLPILSVPPCVHSSACLLSVLLGKLFPSSRLSRLFSWSNNGIDTKPINGKNV